ncbi:MAG: N-acetyltransferase [Chloroflexi bacterium]|nr:N-acetyltransferase [Chloroflexota bacterium]
MKIEKAKTSDIVKIHKLINYFAEKDLMLPRSLAELYENIRDYFVIRENDSLAGCAALHISWVDLAEIKGLAVIEEHQKKGMASELIKACLNEGKELGVERVFCLTYRPEVFENQGFKKVDKKKLPHKIWGECQRCPKFPDCDEIALVCKIKY